MLTESFIASIGPVNRTPSTAFAKDAAIFIHELQPIAAQRTTFKKSATPANCLAVSASHIFAAQADKAVVHVYNREKGHQEHTVAFPERITCIALACENTVLVLGTEKGRLFLWETHTGRQLDTSQAHLQAVTAVVVDHSANLILSGSDDASVHVWSLTRILEFAFPQSEPHPGKNAPVRTLSGHRAAVTSLVLGHSRSFTNFAVSASRDSTCIVWDYHTGTNLRAVLLPSTPLCLALDPADRALYVGYDDGSVQSVDFYKDAVRSGNATSVMDKSVPVAAVQPDAKTRWYPPPGEAVGSTLSIMVSFDGTKLITGHEAGKVIAWDIPRSRFSSSLTSLPLPGAITNLLPLPVTGFAVQDRSRIAQSTILKPRYGAFLPNGDSNTTPVPLDYEMQVQLVGDLSESGQSTFQQMLDHTSFPEDTLADGLAQLRDWQQGQRPTAEQNGEADFMSLDGEPPSEQEQLRQRNEHLQQELNALRTVQKASFEQMEALRKEKERLLVQNRERKAAKVEAEMKEIEKSEKAWEQLGRRR